MPWEHRYTDPSRMLSDALTETGLRDRIMILNTARARERTSCGVRLIGEVSETAGIWNDFVRHVTPPETGVWIDHIRFRISAKPEWKLDDVSISTLNLEPRGLPLELDGSKFAQWLSLAHSVAIEHAPSEFVVTWRRSGGLVARFEALTENHAAASKLHDRLSGLLKAAGSPTKAGVFEGPRWWRVDVEGEDFAVSRFEASESKAEAHRMMVQVSWQDGVLAEANEGVRSLEGLRKLVGTLGERVEKGIAKVSADRFPFVVTVSISVPASLPLMWLQVAIFDLDSHAHFVEVGQDQFFETDCRVLLSIDGSVSRFRVRPFKSIGLARAHEGARLNNLVVAGLELPDNVTERDESLVILGPAALGAPDGWARTWLAIGHARDGEPRPIAALLQASSPTAGDLGTALERARQPAATRGWRQPLRVSRVREVRTTEVVVSSWGAYAGRRAWVVSPDGGVYIGTIEVAGLPTIERPDTVPCKIVELSGAPEAPAFADGQLVIFQPG